MARRHNGDRHQYESKSYREDYRREHRRRSDSEPLSDKPKVEKKMPCFVPSGILLKFYGNQRNGNVLKFTQPQDSGDPKDSAQDWCLFSFENEQIVEGWNHPLTKPAALIGSDASVSDLFIAGDTIAEQHCVIQFRISY